jgi:hypothetical protein
MVMPLMAADFSKTALPIFEKEYPDNAASTCTAGNMAYDNTAVYLCITTNTWMKAAIATWALVPPSITKGVFGKAMAHGGGMTLMINGTTFANSTSTENEVTDVAVSLGNNDTWEIKALVESQTLYYEIDAYNVDIWIPGFTLKR